MYETIPRVIIMKFQFVCFYIKDIQLLKRIFEKKFHCITLQSVFINIVLNNKIITFHFDRVKRVSEI